MEFKPAARFIYRRRDKVPWNCWKMNMKTTAAAASPENGKAQNRDRHGGEEWAKIRDKLHEAGEERVRAPPPQDRSGLANGV